MAKTQISIINSTIHHENQQNSDSIIPTKSTLDFGFWVLLFSAAIIKDISDILSETIAIAINVIPLIGQGMSVALHFFLMGLAWILGAFIIFLLFLKRQNFRFNQAKTLLIQTFSCAMDSVPILNYVPLTTLSVFLIFLLNKSNLAKKHFLPNKFLKVKI